MHAQIHLCLTTTVNREYRLRPLRTSSAMAARSYGVYFRNCLRSNFHRELHRLPLLPESPFPLRPTQDRLTLWCRECVTDNPRKGHAGSDSSDRGCTGYPDKHKYTPPRFRGGTRVFLQESDPLPSWQSMSPIEEEPPTWLISAFYCMARVDTCHPCDCMRSTSTRSSHHLGNHVSFQKDLG
jgi:hypothetical protein